MKFDSKLALILFSVILLPGCTITHKFEPYTGKVVDAETGEPIEGAVVFLRFSTEGLLSPGGSVYKFADVIEVLTERNGEFLISPHRITLFRVPHRWNHHCSVTIFKPGYGTYPDHIDTSPKFDYGSLPEDEFVTIKLPKLKTREERLDNLWNSAYYPRDIPYEKIRHIFSLENQERVELGFEPEKILEQ